MRSDQEFAVKLRMADQHGVIARQEALQLGISAAQVDRLVHTGRWVVLHRGVYADAVPPPDFLALAMAACLAAGPEALASHRSAAYLWRLLPAPPAAPAVTVPRRCTPRLIRVELHRRDDIDPNRIIVRWGIPTTDPLRTLADLGEVARPTELDDAVDRALAVQLVSVDGLQAEVARLARPGRRGVPALRSSLERRGMLGAPRPSVLESKLYRLLRLWGAEPLCAEVVVCDGRYRLDILIRPGLALEVDGYRYHSSPEAKAADSRRRNALRREGIVVIESDWVTVVRHPEVLRDELFAALAVWEREHPAEATRLWMG